MNREIVIYSVVLSASLAGAYYASLPQDDLSEGSQKIANVEIDSINKVVFEKERLAVTVTKKEDGKFWVTYAIKNPSSQKPEKEISPKEGEKGKTDSAQNSDGVEKLAKDDQDKSAEAKTGEDQQHHHEDQGDQTAEDSFIEPPLSKTELFPVSKSWDDFLLLFRPLKSNRDLGKYDNSRAADFGLDKPASLQLLDQKGQVIISLTLGKKSYGGSNNYALLSGNTSLHLIDNEIVAVMEQARSRLFEANLWSKVITDYKKCEINAGSRTRKLDYGESEKGKAKVWLDEHKNKENAGFSYASWMEKLEKLRAVRYATESEAALVEAASPLALISFDGGLDTITFFKIPGKELSPPVNEDTYWVKTSYTSSIAMLTKSRSESLLQEIEKIFPKE